MQNAVIFRIDAINDARLSERAGIVGLTAAGGIKRGSIKNDGDCAIVACAQIDYPRVELEQARIVVIKSFSCAHCEYDVIKMRERKRERWKQNIDRIDMIDTIKEERLVFSLYPRNPDYQEQKSWFIYNS